MKTETQRTQEAKEIVNSIIEKYGETPCCELPNSEFAPGGLFDLLANIDGHASGKSMMNDCPSRWEKSAESVAKSLLKNLASR